MARKTRVNRKVARIARVVVQKVNKKQRSRPQKKGVGRRRRNQPTRNDQRDHLVSAPVAVGMKSVSRGSKRALRTIDEKKVRVFHTSLTAATPSGTLVFAKKIAPAAFPGSRMRREADLFAKYWFDQFMVSMPAGNPSSTTGRYLLAWFDDPEIELETEPTALINQCLGATHCMNASWWVGCEMDYSTLANSRADSKVGLETNPSPTVRANEPYRVYPGLLVMVTDGNIAASTSIDVAVNLGYRCRFWDEVTRKVDLTSSDADVVIDLGNSVNFPAYALQASGAVAVAPGLPANVIPAATEFINQLNKQLLPGRYYVVVDNTMIPGSAQVTASQKPNFAVNVAGSVKFYEDITSITQALPIVGNVTPFILAQNQSNVSFIALPAKGVPTQRSEVAELNHKMIKLSLEHALAGFPSEN